jgi:hypothetical protein
MNRPHPPEHLHQIGYQLEPANEVADWARACFINEDSPLINPEHEHLRNADIVFLWTNVEYIDGGMPVAGMAEIVQVNGKPWPSAERVDHLCLMHGRVPQARIWLYAPYAATCSDAAFCALVEHELLHYRPKFDKEGEPVIDDEGRPKLVKRAHDVSEFISIVRRYGVGAVHPNVQLMVEAAQMEPLITRAQIEAVCGTCGARI